MWHDIDVKGDEHKLRALGDVGIDGRGDHGKAGNGLVVGGFGRTGNLAENTTDDWRTRRFGGLLQAKEDKGVAAKAKPKGKAMAKQVMAEFYRLRAGQVDMFAFEKVGRELLLLLKGAGWYSAVMFR